MSPITTRLAHILPTCGQAGAEIAGMHALARCDAAPLESRMCALARLFADRGTPAEG